MAKHVKLLQDITVDGVLVEKNAIGQIMSSPWQPSKGEYVDAPNVENGTVKVVFGVSPDQVTATFSMESLANFVEDVEVGTANTELGS